MGYIKKKILKLDTERKYKVVETTVEKKREETIKSFTLALATEIGFSIVVPLVAGAGAGVWLDDKFGTKPKLTLLFLLVGTLFSFVSFYNIIKGFLRNTKK